MYVSAAGNVIPCAMVILSKRGRSSASSTASAVDCKVFFRHFNCYEIQ